MMNHKLLDTVATLKPISINLLTLVEPEYQSIQNLSIGQVGTIVQIYEADQFQYLVEFADVQGREYAMAILRADEILALHYELTLA
ncbi:DUF4926 domain-containing protein [Leptolyngbya sp. FACHB-36]|uniref:DUF4926 domain-containing protein n=1 Tax=Leptolyngbya sp. FACHB-36 TaxID=2692808 RepID=UPI00168092EC|nr:DUF4926 domain-containing protein [Leptolyngbya sp. FACHB-36]MBD2020669.1 DUF4926 domain-containing protein [Leptolyngbya sp. FACHB-36]